MRGTDTLRVWKKDVTIHKMTRGEMAQDLLPGMPKIKLKKKTAHIKMGLMFECLTAGIFGGHVKSDLFPIKDSSHVVPYGRGDKGGKKEVTGVKVDVYNKWRKTGYESKGVCNGGHCNLYDFQVTKYKQWLIDRPTHKLYWVFWRHSFRGIQKYNGTESKLYEIISRNIASAIVVPFSVVFHMWLSGGIFLKHYSRDYLACSVLPSITCNRFITDPTEILLGFGLPTKRFDCKLYRSNEKLNFEGNTIPLFPIMIIHDNEWRKFNEELGDTPNF